VNFEEPRPGSASPDEARLSSNGAATPAVVTLCRGAPSTRRRVTGIGVKGQSPDPDQWPNSEYWTRRGSPVLLRGRDEHAAPTRPIPARLACSREDDISYRCHPLLLPRPSPGVRATIACPLGWPQLDLPSRRRWVRYRRGSTADPRHLRRRVRQDADRGGSRGRWHAGAW
jgi:hypothetical protein